jgi:3-phenylpropionate/trans-cinnamate dioxygenase ferredoxin subunit
MSEPIRICRLDELPTVGAAAAEVEGRRIALVHTEDGEVYAIDELCTHANISLTEGDLVGCHIECWLHGSRFDVRTGEPDSPPATEPVAVHTVTIEGDDVYVTLAERN